MTITIPDFLTHYYEAAHGPFRSLTALAGKLGPDRYIEAQVWADEPLKSLGWLKT
jgi:hypothetical protein